jgi:uncharacterized phage protein (TIGR02218 family)
MSYDLEEKSRFEAKPVECYLFSLGSSSWGYTSAEDLILVPGWGYAFEPAPIMSERQEYSAEDLAGGIILTVPRTLPCIADFVSYAPSGRLSLLLIQAHRGSLADYNTPFRGSVVGVEWEDSLAKLTCQPITHEFGRLVPRTAYNRQCNWPIYSPQCGVDSGPYEAEGSVTAVLGNVITIAGLSSRPDGWYDAGFASWGGQRRFIVRHEGETLTLMSPFHGIEVGLTVTAYPGCDHTETTCAQKFNALEKHFGFARVPYRNPHTRRAF